MTGFVDTRVHTWLAEVRRRSCRHALRVGRVPFSETERLARIPASLGGPSRPSATRKVSPRVLEDPARRRRMRLLAARQKFALQSETDEQVSGSVYAML